MNFCEVIVSILILLGVPLVNPSFGIPLINPLVSAIPSYVSPYALGATGYSPAVQAVAPVAGSVPAVPPAAPAARAIPAAADASNDNKNDTEAHLDENGHPISGLRSHTRPQVLLVPPRVTRRLLRLVQRLNSDRMHWVTFVIPKV